MTYRRVSNSRTMDSRDTAQSVELTPLFKPYPPACALAVCGVLVLLAGCTVGPNYKRPQVDLPGQFHGAQPDPRSEVSLADTRWADLFGDDALS